MVRRAARVAVGRDLHWGGADSGRVSVGESMKEINLTQNKVALVDDEDFAYLSQFTWRYSCGYARRRLPLLKGTRFKDLFLHREILRIPFGKEVDHINHNSLDNRKHNLRFVTRSQNIQNSKLRKDNTSGVKGVHWFAPANLWTASLMTNGVTKMTYHSSKEEAINAACQMRRSIGVPNV